MASQTVTHSEFSRVCYQTMVELGGGVYIGVFDAEMPGFEPQVLFNSKKTGSTLALRVSKISAAEVRRHIRASDELFEKAEQDFQDFAENACTRVFRQFSQKEGA